jgi:hypothetical protein
MSKLAGVSVFFRDEKDQVFHTYSCYARGLDMLNGAYHYPDLAPKGRDEAGLAYTMEWLRGTTSTRRDRRERAQDDVGLSVHEHISGAGEVTFATRSQALTPRFDVFCRAYQRAIR